MRVDIHRYANVRMPHQILQRLRIHASLGLVAAVGMSTNMRCDLWHLRFENAVVSVYCIFETLFPMTRHILHSILVSKREAYISGNHNLREISWSILQNGLKHSIHIFRHWDFSRSCIYFR